MILFVTGGAGFIGSAVIRQFIRETNDTVVNIDKLTYAGNLDSLSEVSTSPRYKFEKVDICDAARIAELFQKYQPDAVMHLAAESHVDRSIDGPGGVHSDEHPGHVHAAGSQPVTTGSQRGGKPDDFRFQHISTDEVYGSLGTEGFFTEETPYQPNSPYSASKASSDHLVRAWHHTYGLPVVTTNCSNNYGPYQYPEKLIPLMILNARDGKPLPVYGKGTNIRDWLHVDDHARALRLVLGKGRLGETYNIGGLNEKTNLDVVHTICSLMDELSPQSPFVPHKSLIKFVADRPGHDQRYAIDAGKIQRELGWKPQETFETWTAQDGPVVPGASELVPADVRRTLRSPALGADGGGQSVGQVWNLSQITRQAPSLSYRCGVQG